MEIRLYPTVAGVHMTKCEMINKLFEETTELGEELLTESYEGVEEEVMDVLQMCYNIIEKYNIDIELAKRNHFRKLLERGHSFIIESKVNNNE